MFADIQCLLCKAPNTFYSANVNGLFPNLPLAKSKSGVAPSQALYRICLQAEEGNVTRPSKQSSRTLRTSLGYLTFKVNEPVERRLALQSLRIVILKTRSQNSAGHVVPASCLPASTQTRSVHEKNWDKRMSAASVTGASGPVLWEVTSLSMFAVCV